MRQLTFVVAVCGAALSFGVAHAQDTADSTSGARSELFRVAEQTSPQQKAGYAASANQEIREADRTVDRLVQTARKSGDAKAVECLVSRQTAVQALLSVSTASEANLQAALSAGMTQKAELEFRKIAVALSKTRMLVAESQRCAATRTNQSGTTVVDWASILREVEELANEEVSAMNLGFDPPQVTPFL